MTLIIAMHADTCMQDLVMFCNIKNTLYISHLLHILLILFELFRDMDKQGIPGSDGSSLILVPSVTKLLKHFIRLRKQTPFVIGALRVKILHYCRDFQIQIRVLKVVFSLLFLRVSMRLLLLILRPWAYKIGLISKNCRDTVGREMTLSMTLSPRSDLRRMPLRSIKRLDNSCVNIYFFAYHILILVFLFH